MNIETIIHDGKKMAILPVSQLQRLIKDSEMLSDVRLYDAAKTDLKLKHDEIIPFELIERRVSGENAVKIWREYREITQEKLAKISGVSRAMIAAIESQHKKGSAVTLKKLAMALDISLEQLV